MQVLRDSVINVDALRVLITNVTTDAPPIFLTNVTTDAFPVLITTKVTAYAHSMLPVYVGTIYSRQS